VTRPFRFQPPALPEHVLVRPRLLAQLARRWECRLVTVVAGAGFGKTVLLVGAMTDPAGRSAGRDVWLSCEPADESAEHLADGLGAALGLADEAGVDAICASVWALAPTAVCLVLDDVHELPAGSAGASFLERLVVDLPGNGHMVLASRERVPVPTARLTVDGRLVRVGEDDLVFDRAELASFAQDRGVDPALLVPTGGWPALAELTANAGADLVFDYLWEEVLARVGADRARHLARFAAAGGGDDEVATALVGSPTRVDDLLASVPLVERTSAGWAALHPLWEPALRRLVPDVDASEARRAAAGAHRRRRRFGAAVDLLVEAEAWDEALAVLRDAELEPNPPVPAAELGRWLRLLPRNARAEPEGHFAAALEVQARAPLGSLALFESAGEGFRARGDIDGELAVIAAEGLVRWWINDLARLGELSARVGVLAAEGSATAHVLGKVASAAIAHLAGDSQGALEALDGVGDEVAGGWAPTVRWLRSVAYRRDGELARAHDELVAASALPVGRYGLQLEIGRLRIDWLQGRVDDVRGRLPAIAARYQEEGDRHLARETILELASKTAWLGETGPTRDLLGAAQTDTGDLSSPIQHFFRLLAEAALAVAEGDEPAAAELLRSDPIAAFDSPHRWLWRDRAALTLIHVLVPESRSSWASEPPAATLRPGLVLAEALEAAREGDLSPARALVWPEVGVTRAHLPARWVVELAAAATAAGNPPPAALLDALGDQQRPMLRAVLTTSTTPQVAAAAKQMIAKVPAIPAYRLRIGILGPLDLRRDDEAISAADLRRRRVRELLCYLVAHRRVRREEVAAELWPELDDGGRNLRVTLNYLQRVLQPERLEGSPPYFIRSDGTWLTLVDDERLQVDAWILDARLDEADAAERSGAPAAALAAYRAVLPLWRGEPFADVPYAPWAQPPRTRLRMRYTEAALRAGELLLAAAHNAEARDAARYAIAAEPSSEPAYRLLARTHLADGDRAGARRALDDCRTALAQLDIEPDAATLALLASAIR
jgi:LuxR family transcriptional regulator, maltose regulon positive regulatory protein